MNEMMLLVLVMLAGLLLGTIFYGGLWWTVQKGLTIQSPGLWFLGSLVLRMSLTVTGFYYVSGGDWQRLLSCLLGFTIVRIVITRITRSVITPAIPSVKEASHET